MFRLKLMGILLLSLSSFFLLTGHAEIMENEKEEVYLNYLKHLVLDFADKHKDQEDVIVVSKNAHLLYYVRNGQIVQNAQYEGFTINFPVRTALASKYYRTPEGEMYVDRKNPYSQYTLFLSLSVPGAYGIHGGPTYLKNYIAKKEKEDPDLVWVTKKDDTRGCVAVENRVIKYLFAQVDEKTPVLIMP